MEDTNRAQDVFSSLTTFLPLEPKNFLKQLTNQIENNREDKAFHDLWKKEDLIASKNHADFEKSCVWSDLKAHYILQETFEG